MSLAAVFIRLAGEAPPLAIAAYRLGIGSALVAAYAVAARWKDGGALLPGLRRADVPLLGFSSLCLALHFWAWIVSLQHTSVASSVVLVTASPLIVAVASRLLFRETLRAGTVAGIGVGILGGAALAVGDRGGEGRLFGDAMAFLGAVAVVGYMLAGRRLRRDMPATTYNAVVYAGAALMLLALAVGAGTPLNGFHGETYLWLVATGLVPQAIGHSLLNWSLGHVSATAVAISVMAEPVIATAVAVPALGESPPATSLAGGALILAGIYVAMRGRRERPA
ncbi:MAG: DMT family transporter [Chloroflexi bacterium]|nr:DMT family transporter [Chloroflexota bacterium]